jgi:hypothetical protein
MDLWRARTLKVAVPIAAQVPWPDALATFTPFGYAPVANENAIAPVTGPGLPLLMASVKSVASQAGAFLVVPITGALLVWATFLLGRRVATGAVGLGAAWLVATSPTFLMMSKTLMSDVPAAAFWTLATYGALGTTSVSAVLAGFAAAVAILIRPNVAPIAAVIAAWMLIRDRRRAAWFVLTAAPGALIVAAINTSLFGSPVSSGYGELASLFSARNIPPTLASYARWLAETQTPLVFAGLFIVRVHRLLAAILIAVWAVYAAYPAFDTWWFLRFLLPSWPGMFIGTTAAVRSSLDRWRCGPTAAVAVVCALGIYGLVVTAQRRVFTFDEGERHYATVAQLVAAQTEPDAIDPLVHPRRLAALLRWTSNAALRHPRSCVARRRGRLAR